MSAKNFTVRSAEAPAERLYIFFELYPVLDTNQNAAHTGFVQDPTQGDAGNAAPGALTEKFERRKEPLLLWASFV